MGLITAITFTIVAHATNKHSELVPNKETGYGNGKKQLGISHWKGVCIAMFLRGSRSCSFRAELQEFCMCFTHTQGYLFEHRVGMNTLFKRIFYFYITGDDSQRVPLGTWTLDPAPFISHACKTPQFLVAWRNVFGKVSTVLRAVVHCQDAFPWTTGLRNANEACAGGPRQKPNPSHHLDWLMCVTMWEQGVAFHAYQKLVLYIYIYLPFLLFSAACSTPFLICLFVFRTFTIREKEITPGQRHEQCFCMCCWLLLQQRVWRQSSLELGGRT